MAMTGSPPSRMMTVRVSQSMDQTNPVKRTGMIGLGAMGLQMARHMARKGFDVAGYDIDAERCGAPRATASDIAARPPRSASMPRSSSSWWRPTSRSRTWSKRSGLLDALAPGSVICIASSVAPETCRAPGRARRGKGHRRARHAGGARPGGRQQRHAAPSMSAARSAGSRARGRCSQAFGREVLHLGGVGTGQIAKTHQQHAAVGLHGGEFRVAHAGQEAGRRHSAAGRGARPRQRRQLVALALGQEHRQMGGEGHGCGARTGAGRQGADAARRPGRPAGESRSIRRR